MALLWIAFNPHHFQSAGHKTASSSLTGNSDDGFLFFSICHRASIVYYFCHSFAHHFGLNPFLFLLLLLPPISFIALCPLFLLPFPSPPIFLSPRCPLRVLSAPDLWSLCPIPKSTGSSRRSCLKSSPSVRSSLIRVRGTSGMVNLCVCVCEISANINFSCTTL